MLTADNEKINYTDIINLFINYNCHLSLSDSGKNKLLWLNLLKKYQKGPIRYTLQVWKPLSEFYQYFKISKKTGS